MRISMGRFEAVDRSVKVTFTDGDFRHERQVTAVLTPDGEYDRKATRARAEELLPGIERKRAAGAFG